MTNAELKHHTHGRKPLKFGDRSRDPAFDALILRLCPSSKLRPLGAPCAHWTALEALHYDGAIRPITYNLDVMAAESQPLVHTPRRIKRRSDPR